MKFAIKYDINTAIKKIIQDNLDELMIPYSVSGISEITLLKDISNEQLDTLIKHFAEYGIEIVTNQKTALVQRIKDAIIEAIYSDDGMPNVTFSVYLADKLNHSYSYLSNLFSEQCYTSIENFIIIHKIERAKQLLISEELTLTQISYQLNYSSVAHLSNQFKKTTGLTPSTFQRIIRKRSEQEVLG